MKITVLEYCKLFIRTIFICSVFKEWGERGQAPTKKPQRTVAVEHLVTREDPKSLLWPELRLELELPAVLDKSKSSKYQAPYTSPFQSSQFKFLCIGLCRSTE